MLLDKRMRGSRIRIHPFGQRERSRGTFVDRSIQRRSPARPKVASGALEAGGIPARKEKPPPGNRRGFRVKTLAMTYSRMLNAHYHRRICVSLPSSEWDRVVPHSYCHQGEGGGSPDAPRLRYDSAHALEGWDCSEHFEIVSSTCCRGLGLRMFRRSHLRLYGQATRIISTG